MLNDSGSSSGAFRKLTRFQYTADTELKFGRHVDANSAAVPQSLDWTCFRTVAEALTIKPSGNGCTIIVVMTGWIVGYDQNTYPSEEGNRRLRDVRNAKNRGTNPDGADTYTLCRTGRHLGIDLAVGSRIGVAHAKMHKTPGRTYAFDNAFVHIEA